MASKNMYKKPSKKVYKKTKRVKRRARSILGPIVKDIFQGPRNAMPLVELRARGNFLNESRMVTLSYSEQIQVQSQAALTAMGTPYYFALNDLFDPNYTGVGHQPRGFDEIVKQYYKYRVFGARVRMEFIIPTTTTMWCGYHLLNSQQAVYTAGTAFDYANEVPGTQTAKIPVNTQQVCFDTGYIPINQLEGLSYKSWIGDDGFDANASASPAAISKIGLFAGDWAAPGAVSSVIAIIKIEFRVKFYSAKTVATS